MRKKNMVEQVDAQVLDTTRCMLNIGLEMIKQEIAGDTDDDPKFSGLFDMVKGVCNDALDYGEQMTYVLNRMAAQNTEILNKVRMLESKM